MINKNKLEGLYNFVVEKKVIKTNDLTKLGFNYYDISILIKNGVLYRTTRGSYEFTDLVGLCEYGKKVFATDKMLARKYFEKCLQLDMYNVDSNYYLFYYSINDFDYSGSLIYLRKLYHSDKVHVNKDAKLYIRLLNMLMTLPEEFQIIRDNLTIGDVELDSSDTRYQDINLYNDLIMFIWLKKFRTYFRKYETFPKENLNIEMLSIHTLVTQAKIVDMNTRNKIIRLIQEKNFELVYEIMSKGNSKNSSNVMEKFEFRLIREILQIKKSGIVPKNTSMCTKSIFTAINNHDYQRALELNKQNNFCKGIPRHNVFSLLLESICELIEEIKNEKKSVVKEEISVDVEPENKSMALVDVLNIVVDDDKDKLFSILPDYLRSIGYESYEFIIDNLIRIGSITGNTQAMLVLTQMSRNEYHFDLSYFIQEFYMALSKNNFYAARIYLDILSKSESINVPCILTEKLNTLLVKTEQLVEEKTESEVAPFILNETENSQKFGLEGVGLISVSDDSFVTPLDDMVDEEGECEEFVVEKNQELFDAEKLYRNILQDGMILLSPMSEEVSKKTIAEMDYYPDLEIFTIVDEGVERIAIRYKSIEIKHINVKDAFNVGKIYFKNGFYEECIKCYLELLQLQFVRAFAYALIGRCYMKLNEPEKALDFLLVAEHIAKIENKGDTYKEEIDILKQQLSKDKLSQINVDAQKTYVLDDLINYLNESKLDVESACKNLGYSTEQTHLILLDLAQQYYAQEDFNKGDEFYKVVEKSSDKSKMILQYMMNIKKDKFMYKHRLDKSDKQLSLVFKPKK